ncbi:MAG TPA: GAF domain-containing sensor histidine kinase [Anaerolineaceae bacterium]|jgi:signal transduction histidine kinase
MDRYHRLIEVSRDLASTLDLNTLLMRIITAAVEISQSEAASILLYDNTTQQLFFQLATNMDSPNIHGLTAPLEGSIAGWTIIHHQTAIVRNAHNDPRFFDQVEKATQFPTDSLIAVPLITKEKVLGVLEVINKQAGEYTDDDQELLEAIASQAAVAIENTRLFQQSDLISEFVHEIRTPLSALRTASYLLQRPEITPQQQTALAKTVHGETQRLNEMATTFLDLARLESGRANYQLSDVDLAALAEDARQVILPQAGEKEIEIHLAAPANLPSIPADRNKVKQVLLNLLSNAVKYNLPGGSITLTVDNKPNDVSIAVNDTGLGIPPESMPRLFEKFYRVPGSEKVSAGTGLGLSICKQIVEAHCGHIEVQSQPGQGSTFTVFLPKSQPK